MTVLGKREGGGSYFNKFIADTSTLEPGDKVFRIRLGDREELITVDRLKPAIMPEDYPHPIAVPPRRGRPLKEPIPKTVSVEKWGCRISG